MYITYKHQNWLSRDIDLFDYFFLYNFTERRHGLKLFIQVMKKTSKIW
jgi:hypothetical protein